MKLLQLIAGGKEGGAEKFFVRLAGALEEQQVQQQVVIRKNIDRINALRKNRITTYFAPYSGKLDIFSPYIIRRIAKKFQPDIVMSWMNRASSVIPAGNWVNVGRLGGYYNLKYYKKCHHLICNTQDIRDYVIKQGWPEDKTCYLPNFADETASPAISRDKYDTPEGATLVVSFGRLHENKAFDVLIKSLVEVKDVYLWIAGEGPLRQKLEKLVVDLSIDNRVRFLGWQQDVASIYAAGDIFVCPSRHEPLGNVILEAWLHKLPVIAANSQGPGQLIENRKNGLLVSVDDVHQLSAAIKELVINKQLSESLADCGNATYKNNFSKQVVIRKYMDFFNKICSR